jgi:hypothetical protein
MGAAATAGPTAATDKVDVGKDVALFSLATLIALVTRPCFPPLLKACFDLPLVRRVAFAFRATLLPVRIGAAASKSAPSEFVHRRSPEKPHAIFFMMAVQTNAILETWRLAGRAGKPEQ